MSGENSHIARSIGYPDGHQRAVTAVAGARKVVEEGGVGSASASHSFSTPGVHAVTATAVGRDGRRTTVSRTVVVTGPAAPHDGTVPSNI